MNRTVEIHHQKPRGIAVRHDQFLGLGPELLILHEMVSIPDIFLHTIVDTTWLGQIYCLEILHPKHKPDIPMRVD